MGWGTESIEEITQISKYVKKPSDKVTESLNNILNKIHRRTAFLGHDIGDTKIQVHPKNSPRSYNVNTDTININEKIEQDDLAAAYAQMLIHKNFENFNTQGLVGYIKALPEYRKNITQDMRNGYIFYSDKIEMATKLIQIIVEDGYVEPDEKEILIQTFNKTSVTENKNATTSKKYDESIQITYGRALEVLSVGMEKVTIKSSRYYIATYINSTKINKCIKLNNVSHEKLSHIALRELEDIVENMGGCNLDTLVSVLVNKEYTKYKFEINGYDIFIVADIAKSDMLFDSEE